MTTEKTVQKTNGHFPYREEQHVEGLLNIFLIYFFSFTVLKNVKE